MTVPRDSESSPTQYLSVIFAIGFEGSGGTPSPKASRGELLKLVYVSYRPTAPLDDSLAVELGMTHPVHVVV